MKHGRTLWESEQAVIVNLNVFIIIIVTCYGYFRDNPILTLSHSESYACTVNFHPSKYGSARH